MVNADIEGEMTALAKFYFRAVNFLFKVIGSSLLLESVSQSLNPRLFDYVPMLVMSIFLSHFYVVYIRYTFLTSESIYIAMQCYIFNVTFIAVMGDIFGCKEEFPFQYLRQNISEHLRPWIVR